MNGLPRNLNNLERLGTSARLALTVPVEEFGVTGSANPRRARVVVRADSKPAGQTVELRSADGFAARAVLTQVESGVQATLSWPMTLAAPAQEVEVFVAEECIGVLQVPSAEALRHRALMGFDFRLAAYVFSGTTFPGIAFDENELEDLIGPYAVTITYYDSDYRVVHSAERPGRYGAMLEVQPAQGRALRRCHTLFRQPQPFEWLLEYIPVSVSLPPETGFDASAVADQATPLGKFMKERLAVSLRRDAAGASLLAGVHEDYQGGGAAPAVALSGKDLWARDRQWWVTLKRKLSGLDQQFAEPFVAPRPVAGTAARVLRDGSEAEAGMRPGTVERIDVLCQAWAADTDQGFAACVARHGAVFFHRAYGTRYGQPMTTETGSWMASITKLLAGTLVMMVVDQGRVSLDEPIATYLPALRGIPVETPLTLRHLCTHTNGLWDHLGDDMHDFEEVVADYYLYLEVGKRYEYNGAGCALAGKVLEAVTGEALPVCFARHLLDPLGLRHTEITTMSWDTFSIPRDIAVIGQMLLNRGAYGDQRFLSETTLKEMLPQRLSRVLGPDATAEYGIGTSWFEGEGLGEGTFGHGAASAATLRVDPQNDVVVVMSRNQAGRNFDKYHPEFMRIIAQGVEA